MAKKTRYFSLSERYGAAVELLKKHKLWTLNAGSFFHLLIIHTQPPASLVELKNLLGWLVNTGVDEYWCPLTSSQHWLAELASLLKNSETSESDSSSDEIGVPYPVFYGIRHIQKLKWPKEVRAGCIAEFTNIVVHATRSTEHTHRQHYYDHVYKLRDVLINKYADNQLPTGENNRKNLNEKTEVVARLLDSPPYPKSLRPLGVNPGLFKRDEDWLINSPPFIPFQPDNYQPEQPNKQKKKKAPPKPRIDKPYGGTELLDPIDAGLTPDPDGLLPPPQQYAAKKTAHANFMRDNVVSLADPNQLSLHTLISYWRHLVEKDQICLLAVTLAAFLTGIPGKRWTLLASGTSLNRNNLLVSESPAQLRYFIQNGATNFEKGPGTDNESFDEGDTEAIALADSEVMTIPLPATLAKTLAQASNDRGSWNQDPYLRSYARRHTGPRPTIDRIARSGNRLLRYNHFTDSEQGLLAGNVPIALRARNCYVARDERSLGVHFQRMCNDLWSILQKQLNPGKPIYSVLKELLDCPAAPNALSKLIGSQLATQPLCEPPANQLISAPVVRVNHLDQIVEIVQAINRLELNLYWMLQYGIGQRPPGPASESINCDGYRLHSDKDSAHFTESKLLKLPALITQQISENRSARAQAITRIKRHGLKVKQTIDLSDMAWLFELRRSGKSVKVSMMRGTDAKRLSETYWNYDAPFDRSNISRHQCATFAHQQSSELAADLWLGHHIDGLDPFAPESTLGTQALSDLLDLQNEMLRQVGFQVVMNPWR